MNAFSIAAALAVAAIVSPVVASSFSAAADRLESVAVERRQSVETWRAVVEPHESGASFIVEHNASLSDCMDSLESYAAAAVTYCERESI